MEMTDPYTFEQINRIGYHFDPLMVIFAPLYWIFPYADVLIIGQSIFLALGSIPIFIIGRHVFRKTSYSNLMGLVFGLMFLMYRPLHQISLFDFHPVALGVVLMGLLLCSIIVNKGRYFIGLAILSYTVKENITLLTACISMYIIVIQKRLLDGFRGLVVSIVSFIFLLRFLIPAFGSQHHFASGYFTLDVMTNVQKIFSPATFLYMREILQPLGFIPLIAPQFTFMPISEWMINILSSNSNMRLLKYHYLALIIPFIFVGLIYGFRYIAWIAEKMNINQKLALTVCTLIVFSSLIADMRAKSPVFVAKYTFNSQLLSDVRKWQTILRDDSIKVSASGHLSPHFSSRHYFYNFFFDFAYGNLGMTVADIQKLANHYEKADYVLIKKSEVATDSELVLYYYDHLRANSRFSLIEETADLEVYKKLSM